MVAWLARWFRQRNVRVALVSRGYGAEQGADERPEPPIACPGEPESLRHHIRLMIDLLIVALQIDYTRA